MISDQELENKVDKLFDKLTPDLSGQILKDIDSAQKPAAKKRNRKKLWLRIGSMAAVFVLLAVGAFSYAGYARIDLTVSSLRIRTPFSPTPRFINIL